jgi:hypothetical protein
MGCTRLGFPSGVSRQCVPSELAAHFATPFRLCAELLAATLA